MNKPLVQRFHARWVVPISSPPIENGIVEITNGQITKVNSYSPNSDVIDLGDVALLPGLINCHTHLEFSDLGTPIGQPGNSLPEWIVEVVKQRRDRSESETRFAIEKGLEECHLNGTRFVGEIATTLGLGDIYANSPVDGILFDEKLGSNSQDIQALLKAAKNQLRDPAVEVWGSGLSPHAPYSTHRELISGCVNLCREFRLPLAIHLAESREELEWLNSRSGGFATMLQKFGIPIRNDGYRSVPEIISDLADAPSALIVHGNYLTDVDLDLIAKHQQTFSVVYCPRTHEFFAHEPYPLHDMLARGIRVVLGTDSRASNPDLDILAEARFVAKKHPNVKPETILRMLTCESARAFKNEKRMGTIEPGKSGRLSLVEISPGCNHPVEEILQLDGRTAKSLEIDKH